MWYFSDLSLWGFTEIISRVPCILKSSWMQQVKLLWSWKVNRTVFHCLNISVYEGPLFVTQRTISCISQLKVAISFLDICSPSFTFLSLRGDVKEAAVVLTERRISFTRPKKTNNSKIFLPSYSWYDPSRNIYLIFKPLARHKAWTVQKTTWKHKKYFILQNVLKNNELGKLAYTNEDKCISC